MKELNKNTLKAALQKLPEYQPEELLWDKVNKDLNQTMPRTALQAAIQALPEYSPPDFVWENVIKILEEEKPQKLEDAIQYLPTYEPPSNLWDQIQDELEEVEAEEVLRAAITDLPEYEPTGEVWENIEAALGHKNKTFAKIISFQTWKRYAAAAAMIGILLTAAVLFFNNNLNQNNYAYSQELVDEQTLSIEWEADEQDFQSILAVCLERKYVCEQPAFLDLKSELLELNEAKDELKTVLQTYGKDPKLIQQLTKIEHQRSDVLKKMVVLI